MPIFEFKCVECNDFFELLIMNKNEKTELNCPRCKSENFERVLSTTNYSMNGKISANDSSANTQTRSCSGGSCTTYNVPGCS